MVPRNDANGGDEITGTTARWFAANAIAISRAEFERLNASRKSRADSSKRPSPTTKQPTPLPSTRDYASAAPSMVNGIEDEAPTLMWDSSHVSAMSKNLSPSKRAPVATPRRAAVRRESAPEKAQSGVIAKTNPTPLQVVPAPSKDPTIKIWPQPIAQASDEIATPVQTRPVYNSRLAHLQRDRPPPAPRSTARASVAATHVPTTPPPLPSTSIPPTTSRHAAVSVPIVQSPQPQAVTPHPSRAPKTRPYLAPTVMVQPRMSAGRSRIWIWNTLSGTALFTLVMVGRLLIANSPANTAKAPVGVKDTKASNNAVGVAVEAVGRAANAGTDTTAASSVVPPVADVHQLQPPPPDRVTRRAPTGERAAARTRATSNASRARHVSTPTEANPETGTLRVNSRPWSQVFVDDNLVGNTPQANLQLNAGRHKIKLVNESMGYTRTFEITLKPGQTLTKVVNLIE